MRLDLFTAHTELTRRGLLRAGAAAGAVAVVGTAGSATAAPSLHDAVGTATDDPADREGDELFDVEAVIAGAWAPGPYGEGDQRGSFNEVTPAKTASALRLLDAGRPVKTYGLGEELFNGFPAYAALLYPRQYEQRLTVLGYVPTEPGPLVQLPVPFGPNKVSAHEERLVGSTTYHIGTQVDGLAHIGVGDMFYGGNRGPDIAAAHGLKRLGNEHMGPIVTRGVVADVVGLKVAQGATSAYFTADNGRPVLQDDYRITVEDIEQALRRAGRLTFGPGDVVLLRTGWTHLVEQDPARYTAKEPGIYLREARWLAKRRPAIVGGDAWALESLNPEVIDGNSFPVHQLLLVKHGIRIGESILTDDLVDDGVHEFVFMYSPQNARGATAGCTPPVALAQPSV
ncbi:MAG TPA: cyclase family protein [Mycobacteriales bacterium]|nr:cyclase family protein [Mycobacteriales bacterium]